SFKKSSENKSSFFILCKNLKLIKNIEGHDPRYFFTYTVYRILPIVVILFVSGIVALLLQSLISFIVYPIGVLFFYYVVILLLASSLKDQFTKIIISIIICILLVTPIIWILIAPEYLFDLLMPKLNIDMK